MDFLRIVYFLSLITALSLGWARPGFADGPCPQSQTANAPLSDPNAETLDTSASVAADIADAPQPTPWYRVTVGGDWNSGTRKLSLPDFTTLEAQASSNPSDPNHNQANNDITSAFGAYLYATDQARCQKPGQPALSSVCGVTSFGQYQAYLRQQGQSLDLNAKLELLSMLGNQLAGLYNNNAGSKETPLPTVFKALITGAQNAGVCRDIHEFLAVTAASLGFKNAGTTTSDWNSGETNGAHTVAQFQDPQSGKYIFISYGEIYQSNSKYVSEASQEMAQGLNAYSTATQVETGSAGGKPTLHQMQDPRAQQLQSEIDEGSDMSQPHLQIAVGNYANSASLHTQLFGGDEDRVGVFALATENAEGDPVQAEAAGARADLAATKPTGRDMELDLKASAEAGVLGVEDQAVAGVSTGSRTEVASFGTGRAEGDFSWNGPKNSGHVGIQITGEDAIYVNGGSSASENIPFDTFNVVAVDNVAQGLQLHFTDSGFVTNRTTQDVSPAYHHADDAIGAKFTGRMASRVTASNDVTVHDFNGRAIGIHDEPSVMFHTARHGEFSLGADVAYLKNKSSDDFYNYPLTCGIEAGYQKKFDHFTLNATGKYNCNEHNVYTLMQGDSELSNPGWLLQQPQMSAGFTLSW